MSLIYIFTGDGKGKTTAAFGTALRALARNKKVHIIQFMKHPDWFDIGEVNFLKNVSKNITIEAFGRKGWVNPKSPSEEDKQIVANAYQRCLEVIEHRPFLLISDEILVAYLFKILKAKDVVKLIKSARENEVNLILTGRGGTNSIYKHADLVSEMKLIKHHYDEGRNAIEGLEY